MQYHVSTIEALGMSLPQQFINPAWGRKETRMSDAGKAIKIIRKKIRNLSDRKHRKKCDYNGSSLREVLPMRLCT
jgi:hypothetical protein